MKLKFLLNPQKLTFLNLNVCSVSTIARKRSGVRQNRPQNGLLFGSGPNTNVSVWNGKLCRITKVSVY